MHELLIPEKIEAVHEQPEPFRLRLNEPNPVELAVLNLVIMTELSDIGGYVAMMLFAVLLIFGVAPAIAPYPPR